MASLAAGIYLSVIGMTARRMTMSEFYRGDIWHWIGMASCVVLGLHLLLLIAQLPRKQPIQLRGAHVRFLFILVASCWLYIIFFVRPTIGSTCTHCSGARWRSSRSEPSPVLS